MKAIEKSEQGLLTLEASIVVTGFIFLMLFMYSIFVVFEARSAIGHAVLSTANSLALDAYENSRKTEITKALDSMSEEAKAIATAVTPVAGIFISLYGTSGDEDSPFVNRGEWYEDSVVDNGDGSTRISDVFLEAVKERFFAYLGGGDPSRAEQILKLYHIKDGESGLDFSNSYTDANNLYISVKYNIEYEYKVFHFEPLEMEQKACSKLWKSG